jgi:hypothetical protein
MDTLIDVGSTIFSHQIHLEPDFVYEMLRCLSTTGQWTNGKKGSTPSLVGGGGVGFFFFSFDLLKADGRGRGLIVFEKFIMGSSLRLV